MVFLRVKSLPFENLYNKIKVKSSLGEPYLREN
jgi:hypothetical protein